MNNHAPNPFPDLRLVPCDRCDGNGTIEQRHPAFGSPSCPSPSIEVRCEWCDGTGYDVIEVEPITMEDLDKINSH